MKRILIAICLLTLPVHARERIRIVGSTAVYGFSTVVAEHFAKMTHFKAPIVEATGTGGGINLFCGGAGDKYPDIVNTSRPMSTAEMAICRKNNVKNVQQVEIGYDGIVIGANCSDALHDISTDDLFAALAEKLTINGKIVNNPYTHWQQINPQLPNKPIIVLGPTASLATREVFEDAILRGRSAIRSDGHFIEVSEHENVIVQRLNGNKDAIGIFSYSFLVQNPNKVKAIKLNGILPNPATIKQGTYPISRKLYMYIKKDSQVEGIDEFVDMFKSKNAIGANGYLTRKGLINKD